MTLRVEADGSLVVSAPWNLLFDDVADFVRSKRDWIEAQRTRLKDSPAERAANASEAELREWRQIVEGATLALLEHWEPIIGVRSRKLAFRNMKSRWGSCQPATGRICINIRLAAYPPKALEYVVVHELVHMLEPSHNKRFHDLMTQYLPDWKQRKKLLR